jgi:hypothetical protein
MREIRRRVSWVGFLAPLPEGELDDLLRGASFFRLEAGEVTVVAPKEHAERMLLVVGQLQVFEVFQSSERGLTLSVLSDGAAVGATGLVPRWTRELHLRALEPSLVCGVRREDLERRSYVPTRKWGLGWRARWQPAPTDGG